MSTAILRTLIVDDEPIARQVLREELEILPAIEVVGEAGDGLQALQMISETAPDLVFLDLQMPQMSGFEVVRQMEGRSLPVVVFVTAYDQYAIQAFDAGAVDYLLKPVRQARLIQTIGRVRTMRPNPRSVVENLSKLQELAPGPAKKIIGRLGEEYVLLNPAEVLAFQAEGDLVWIVTAKQRLLATQTLRGLQERLAGQGFERIHRNSMVNLQHVRKLAALSSQRWLLTLANGQEFTVSKRQVPGIRQLLDF